MKNLAIDFSFKLIIGLSIFYFLKIQITYFKTELRKSYDTPDTSYILRGGGYRDTLLLKKSIPQILK